MSEKKKYLLQEEEIDTLRALAVICAEKGERLSRVGEQFLEEHEYHERTCHNIELVCDDMFVCSECGAQYATRGYIEDLNIVTSDGEWAVNKYCPNCGAKVKE